MGVRKHYTVEQKKYFIFPMYLILKKIFTKLCIKKRRYEDMSSVKNRSATRMTSREEFV